MKHATTLVCIILLVLFLDTGTNRIEYLSKSQPKTAVIELENNLVTDSSMGTIDDLETIITAEQDQDSAVSNVILPLNGKVICLDPGHQSKIEWIKVPIAPSETFLMPDYSIGTKGAESRAYEYSIALQVAQKLKGVLKSLGASVILTRESDEQAVGNIKRTEIACEANADITVSLHCDGIDDSSIHGLTVLYPGEKYITDSDILDESLKLSEEILKSTVASTGAKNRGLAKRNGLIVFNYSRVPCTLIEMGFLTNPNEDRLLNSEDYQNKIAEGISQGIMNYFDLLEKSNDEEIAEVTK